MAVSKEQWAEIEAQLGRFMGCVELMCDGYKISAEVERNKMTLVVSVYVDGYIRGEWIFNKGGSEIPLKFHQEKKRFVFGAKYRALLTKQSKSKFFSKDERDKAAADAKKTGSHWWPHWPNAKAFCRHIRKTCTSIEVVKIGC